MLLILHKKGKVSQVIQDGEVRDGAIYQYGRKITSGLGCEYAYVPDQDTAHLQRFIDGTSVVEATYPDDFVAFTLDEKALLADRDKADAINAQIHPYAPLETQIGILRKQLDAILAAMQQEPTADYKRLQDIAEAEIAKEK